ncbi:winged helix-turn-helix transcriptional regulator [Parasphingopyxis lamellibrachiae]|uniref:HxlR family transcriptional regulator n=1 Tax=Parasphingopyxis lamellibrachiae TaxID=680125 RepID=A0A3D9FKE8_9SPHN|nr:winged helix-turn-helix transcriptional regulator [Parasphingopyxis lamellibrachiae]RED17576.1 HxlR family transcriptional regulator [Parasphingopyxis lamellibrachiae]
MLLMHDIRILGERRWAVPVLSALADEGGGGRFVLLLNRVGCARSALASTLDHLKTSGWIKRNPGHGHPLRPEYLLTPKGAAIASQAQNIGTVSDRLNLTPRAFQRWTLPLTYELQASPRRFTQLKSELAPATPRALSLTLKQMIGNDLVSRRIVEEFPPAPLYDLTARGRDLAQAL